MTETSRGVAAVQRLVVIVVAVGALSAAATLCLTLTVWSDYDPTPPPYGPSDSWAVLLVAVGLTTLGHLLYVRVRRGGAIEELNFWEVALAAMTLLLPPSFVLVASLASAFIGELMIRRREWLKIAFNLGNYATSTSVMVITYNVLAGTPPGQGPAGASHALRWDSIASLVLSALAFATVNLLHLAWLLRVTAGAKKRDVLAEEWRLSALMALGSVAIGSMTAACVIYGLWALLPFASLPALALWYAYVASAQHAEAEERNRYLVALGGVLARRGHKDDLADATDAVRQIVGAPLSEILDPRVTVATGQVRLLASLAADPGPRALVGDELPTGWQTGVVTRLDLGGSEHGALLLGSTEHYRPSRIAGRTRGWSLEEADAPVLGALVAAVGSSMRAGAAFATLTEERDKLTAVVDNTSDGIAMVDDAGRVRLWSQTMVRMTGVRPEDLGPDLESAPSVVQVLVRAARSGSRAAGAPPVQVTLVRGDGETLDVSVTTTRVREATIGADAAEQGWVSILTVHDETRERRVERMKTDFIATVSHELRTPITPIKGYAHLLATRRDRLPADKVTEKLLLIASSADHLERLVDDLLMAQRVSGSANLRVEMAVQDLEDVVRQAVDGFPQLAGRISVAVPDHPVEIQCDRDRTVQCLANLIGNAEKYAPDSPVEISADVVGSHARIHVRDHGAGIPEAEREKVFARFYRREDPFTMRTGGAGLGLHIARELAESMGGGLTLEDPAQGSGAEFVLHLLTTDAPMVAYAAHGPEQSASATGIRKGQAWRLPRSADAEGAAPDTTRDGHEVVAQEPGDGTMGTSADRRAAI